MKTRLGEMEKTLPPTRYEHMAASVAGEGDINGQGTKPQAGAEGTGWARGKNQKLGRVGLSGQTLVSAIIYTFQNVPTGKSLRGAEERLTRVWWQGCELVGEAVTSRVSWTLPHAHLDLLLPGIVCSLPKHPSKSPDPHGTSLPHKH